MVIPYCLINHPHRKSCSSFKTTVKLWRGNVSILISNISFLSWITFYHYWNILTFYSVIINWLSNIKSYSNTVCIFIHNFFSFVSGNMKGIFIISKNFNQQHSLNILVSRIVKILFLCLFLIKTTFFFLLKNWSVLVSSFKYFNYL